MALLAIALVACWSAPLAADVGEPPAVTPRPVAALSTATPGPPAPPQQGAGVNIKGLKYDDDSYDKALALGQEWLKIYDHPPAERLPFKVLYRVNLPVPGEDWEQWGRYRFLDAELYADRIDAYEIGNEPNLIEEWGGNPDPAAYARLLEIAYREIKAADPDALVVSAGLAPVGEGAGPAYVSDLVFIRQMYENGAAAHFDVLGVHLFGFDLPPETAPDGAICPTPRSPNERGGVGGEPLSMAQGCRPVEGWTFRRAELVRAIMAEFGDGDKPVWTTEFGWIIRPPSCCLNQSDWPLRAWQAVSEGQQARYTVRAFAYAEEHWPWMEVMFLWNLDWSRYFRGQDETCLYCESMGWYSVLNPDGSPRLAYKWLLGERTPH